MSNAATETLNDKRLRLWGIPTIAITNIFGLMPFFFPGRWDLFCWYLPIAILYIALAWEFCRRVFMHARQRFPGLSNTRRRLLYVFGIYVVVVAAGQLALNYILGRWGIMPPTLRETGFWGMWLINFLTGLFFVLLLASLYEIMYFFEQYKKMHQKAEHLKTQQAQQKLDALKNRVNPHFLFNSLTTLSALIGEDQPKAERFVDELSKVYRYMLRAGRQQTASLGEELQFADSYVFLLKNRFDEGAFSMKFLDRENSAQIDRYLPALSLQNTFDYLMRTQNAPIHIQAKLETGRLHVFCQYQPKTLSFDLPENDWRQLEAGGASQKIDNEVLSIFIPFISTMPNK